MSTSSCRSARLISHSWWSGVFAMTSQPSASSTDVPCASSMTWRATHVGACTPLVIDVIGTSSLSKPDHRPANMPRETWPCRRLTPLARCAMRRPMTAMLNTAGSPPSYVSAPRASTRSTGDAGRRVVAAEVLRDEIDREAVDARGHGGVRGEHGARAADLERLVERHRRILGDELADALEAEEAGVALVRVEDLGCRGAGDAAVGAQGANAADAEQHLLLQAMLAARRRTGGR